MAAKSPLFFSHSISPPLSARHPTAHNSRGIEENPDIQTNFFNFQPQKSI